MASPVSLMEWFMSFYEHKESVGCAPRECTLREGELLFVPVSHEPAAACAGIHGLMCRCTAMPCAREQARAALAALCSRIEHSRARARRACTPRIPRHQTQSPVVCICTTALTPLAHAHTHFIPSP